MNCDKHKLIEALKWALSDDPELVHKAESVLLQAELEEAREDEERDRWAAEKEAEAEAAYWQARVDHDNRNDPLPSFFEVAKDICQPTTK